MANDNCLDGIRCPKCGSEEPFYIEAIVTVLAWDSGTEDVDGTSVSWDYDSHASCAKCEWAGTLRRAWHGGE